MTAAVYIMGNKRPTMYVGMTNNLHRRVLEHKDGKGKAFTKRYKLTSLLYYEIGGSIFDAIVREKQIKNMSRKEKIEMIQGFNPTFKDMTSEIFDV